MWLTAVPALRKGEILHFYFFLDLLHANRKISESDKDLVRSENAKSLFEIP